MAATVWFFCRSFVSTSRCTRVSLPARFCSVRRVPLLVPVVFRVTLLPKRPSGPRGRIVNPSLSTFSTSPTAVTSVGGSARLAAARTNNVSTATPNTLRLMTVPPHLRLGAGIRPAPRAPDHHGETRSPGAACGPCPCCHSSERSKQRQSWHPTTSVDCSGFLGFAPGVAAVEGIIGQQGVNARRPGLLPVLRLAPAHHD